MKHKMSNILVTICFGIVIFGLMLGTLFVPRRDFSVSERRRLAVMPSLNLTGIINGAFFAEGEDYLLDHMIFRDFFRGVKAFTVYNILQRKENNDLYLIDGWINKIEYPLNPISVQNAALKFNDIHGRYFPDQKAWLAVIPDKSFFLAESHGYLAIDYLEMMTILTANTGSVRILDLFNTLSIEDYYYTDIHWRQENLLPVADYLMQEMGHQVKASDQEYERLSLYPFKGSYYGQLALPVKPDSLVYLTNDQLSNARVYDYEKDSWTSIYTTELFSGMDPYDVYLGGAKSIIKIFNDSAASERELIIFRDSFGSSLAPLLLPGYSSITLVDLRYIRTELLEDFIEFNHNQDILFLYSVQVLNNSAMLR